MKKTIKYFDCHVDTLTEIGTEETLWKNSCNLDLSRVEAFAEQYIQVFALWRDRKQMDMSCPCKEFVQIYSRAVSLLQEQEEKIMLCQNRDELQKALAMHKAAALLAVEDVSIMGDMVDSVRELGIAIVMLTWNYANQYGAGAAFSQERGLTEKGKRLVESLAGQGVILDISHLSDAGVCDVLSLTTGAVIASHSNVRKVCMNPRNLLDTHIQEIIKRRGIIGINYYGPFVEPDTKDGMTALLRHMDAILELGGEDALVLGSDFDGCGNQLVNGIKGVEAIPYLAYEMEQAGFGERLISKIFWENGYQFLLREMRA